MGGCLRVSDGFPARLTLLSLKMTKSNKSAFKDCSQENIFYGSFSFTVTRVLFFSFFFFYFTICKYNLCWYLFSTPTKQKQQRKFLNCKKIFFQIAYPYLVSAPHNFHLDGNSTSPQTSAPVLWSLMPFEVLSLSVWFHLHNALNLKGNNNTTRGRPAVVHLRPVVVWVLVPLKISV